MNHFSPPSSFETLTEPVCWKFRSEKQIFVQNLRNFAAQFQMHYAVVHRLGPSNTAVKDATYVSTQRDLDASAWTLGDLITMPALDRLFAGNCAVSWQRSGNCAAPKPDPLSRLDIQFGISHPFHNALGNHAALTLFDRQHHDIDRAEFTRLALPLIDAVLTAERSNNKRLLPLSERETHCLQWAAAGKTSIETGMILGLSPHTVNQYLTAATAKLEAVNKTHAVTKAVRLGLINLSLV